VRPAVPASVGLTTLAEPVYSPDGELRFAAPPGAYAGLPAWHSAAAWLGAVKLHPQMAEACAARKVAPATFLRVLRALAGHADIDTGRNIAVAHETVAAQLEVCAKTVQRSERIGEAMGVLVRVLDGADMSGPQRYTVLGHYTRGTKGAKWRALPNYYAAVMPRSATALAPARPKSARVRGYASTSAVDNREPGGLLAVHSAGRLPANVHLPEGSKLSSSLHVPANSRNKILDPPCAQPPATSRPQLRTQTTAAARPTRTHQRTDVGPRGRRLDPNVRAFATTLRSMLPGYRALSLHRVCPALSRYVSAGLSPSQMLDGLDNYLATTGHTWITDWRDDQAEAQARYLIGMLTRARQAGYIRPS
jgi:hypothetical protein